MNIHTYMWNTYTVLTQWTTANTSGHTRTNYTQAKHYTQGVKQFIIVGFIAAGMVRVFIAGGGGIYY